MWAAVPVVVLVVCVRTLWMRGEARLVVVMRRERRSYEMHYTGGVIGKWSSLQVAGLHSI